MEKDLLNQETFEKLWNTKEENKKFCELLKYLKINISQTILIQDEKYIILYDQKEKEYIVFSSRAHPLEEDFLTRKEQFKIQKLRIIILN